MIASIIERARNYISRMESSIQGSNGSASIFKVAVALVRGFNLPDEDAFRLLAEWNESNSLPPWSEPELRHKLKDAAATTGKEAGYLLNDADKRLPLRPAGAGAWHQKQAEERARKRSTWPEFKPLSPHSIEAIATLRKLPFEAVEMARARGLLWGAKEDGERCFVIREGNFAQARRFDGSPFVLNGRQVKAKNLAGAEGYFIGQTLLGDADSPVLIVEGAISLIEGIAAILAVGANWTVLAATSAGSKLEPAILSRMAGRRVRIVPDSDAAGLDGLARWTASLLGAGATVDAFRLPEGMKDLGPAVADPERHRGLLTEIFTV
jgi:hypothetical protein